MSDILRQVDEELRQDRLKILWKKYRIYIVGMLILIIGGVFGYQTNKSVNQSYYEKTVEKYIAIAGIKNLNESIKNLSEIEGDNQLFISSIAKIKAANLLMENGNTEESMNKLKEIMNDDNSDKLVADIATYFYLMSNLNEINKDEINIYITSERENNSSLKYLFKEAIATAFAVVIIFLSSIKSINCWFHIISLGTFTLLRSFSILSK